MDSERPILLVSLGTTRRPKFLRDCLASLAAAIPPEGVDLRFLIVCNDADAIDDARAIAGALAWPTGASVEIVFEEPQGFPFVRNVMLAHARAIGAEWNIQIDDDQIVPKDFLTAMLAEQRETGADVVKPQVEWRFEPPGAYRDFFETPWSSGPTRSFSQWMLAGNGILFNRRFLSDRSMRYVTVEPKLGGSDMVLMRDAKAAGYALLRTRNAIIFETCPSSRQTFFWILKRAHRMGYVEAFRELRPPEKRRSALGLAGRIGYSALKALVLSPSPKRALKAALRTARFVGALQATLRFRAPQEYKRIHDLEQSPASR